MDHEFGRTAMPVLACFLLLLPGCGSINVWPFGGESNPNNALVPANATEFQCAGGKRFYMRYLDNGSAAWIILPDREFRLDKVASGGTRYSNGIAMLDVNDKGTTLTDGPGITFSGCKTDTK